jgi:fructose/tagatose bisphosphate aldolase
MSLEPINRLMRAARDKQYAVGYFESWNLDSLQGVIEAAEKTRSPIIIGFKWGILERAREREPRRCTVVWQAGARGR